MTQTELSFQGAFDPTNAEFIANPYAFYKRMREAGRIHRNPVLNNWVLTRYDDMVEVLRDDERFSADRSQGENAMPSPGGTNFKSMLSSDPPDHTRLRTIVNKAFTARTVRNLQPRIREIVDDLLDRMDGDEDADLIRQYAYPIPITVIAELLGVPAEDQDDFREWSNPIALALGPQTSTEVGRKAMEGRDKLVAYFNDILPKRKADPGDDLITALLETEEQGDQLSHGELMVMLNLLLIAGHETTVNLIGNGIHALLRHPDQRELLRERPELAKSAVEECLRYDSPVQSTGRIVKVSTEIAGQVVEPRQSISTPVGCANHDEDRFDEPERFDITRDPNPHLSFSAGIHFCLGAPLAKLEGQIAIPAIFERFPKLRLATEETKYRPAVILRGLESLPVTL